MSELIFHLNVAKGNQENGTKKTIFYWKGAKIVFTINSAPNLNCNIFCKYLSLKTPFKYIALDC